MLSSYGTKNLMASDDGDNCYKFEDFAGDDEDEEDKVMISLSW